jgi:hypothetical protein
MVREKLTMRLRLRVRKCGLVKTMGALMRPQEVLL